MFTSRVTQVTFLGTLSVLVVATALASGVTAAINTDTGGGGFNTPGNILITDQFNNRVIEVDPQTHNVVWTFGNGSSTPGPISVVGTNDAERVGNLTLIAGTGAPGGTEPTCPPPNGCPDNRVLLVNQQGQIVWQYGQAGVIGSGPNQLNTPVANVFLPNGNIMITDQANERVIIVTPDKEIVWQYGQTGVSGVGFNQLNNPNSAELLVNGHILIADENNNRVIEVAPATHQILWQYPATPNPASLNGAAFASRLPNGNTLITDSNNNRVIEVTKTGTVVFTYSTLDPAGNPNPLPTRAVRLSQNGLTLISDQFNDRVIAATQAGQIVFTQGMLNMPGSGFNQTNAPYSAYVIGNYFGLTPPQVPGGDSGAVTGTDTAKTAGQPLRINTASEGYPCSGRVCSFPTGNVGTSYAAPITSTGGSGPTPYTWSVVSGSLPAGLSLTPYYGVYSAYVYGTPTAAQTSSFTLQVRDGVGHTARQAFSLTINTPAPLVITFPSSCCPNGTIGQSYLQNFFASGGVQPYTWSISTGQLPPGLSLSPSPPASITGAPTTSGTFTFNVRVTDHAGSHADETGSISVH